MDGKNDYKTFIDRGALEQRKIAKIKKEKELQK